MSTSKEFIHVRVTCFTGEVFEGHDLEGPARQAMLHLLEHFGEAWGLSPDGVSRVVSRQGNKLIRRLRKPDTCFRLDLLDTLVKSLLEENARRLPAAAESLNREARADA